MCLQIGKIVRLSSNVTGTDGVLVRRHTEHFISEDTDIQSCTQLPTTTDQAET